MTGSAAAAAGVGFVALLVLSIASAVPGVGRYLPGGLAGPAVALAAGAPVDAGDVLTSRSSRRVVLIAAAVGLAAWSFRRQEL